ncbi:interferon-related developmental regulator 2 [Octopus bimaculoides]|uniref:Interferon-related developmental regulator N-terminal domain-containing protein n=1 Tax=Octopus bimaculoides TaxID=37653 RepID=A0A0L8GHD6_OCTBM|nr:interferon-related developmental regulator 2 [Octopus bimaculoides]|eukprot:XP_014781341.1 PREDICTED: interferon-related developmental regulator 2-like [Octopus bimaculoides]
MNYIKIPSKHRRKTTKNQSSNMKIAAVDQSETNKNKLFKNLNISEAIESLQHLKNIPVKYINDKDATFRIEQIGELNIFLSRHYFKGIHMNSAEFEEILKQFFLKGDYEEQMIFTDLFALILIQLGSNGRKIFEQSYQHLVYLLHDPNAVMTIREKCAETLAISAFVSYCSSSIVENIMTAFEKIFCKPIDRAACRTYRLETSLIVCSLSAWALLLSSDLSSSITKAVNKETLVTLEELLSSKNLHVRICAAEVIALIFESMQEDEYNSEEGSALKYCHILKTLLMESSKHYTKTDRSNYKTVFKDVIHFLEDGSSRSKKISVGNETIDLSSWKYKKRYEYFCRFLGSGINNHMQTNNTLRNAFDLQNCPVRQEKLNFKERQIINNKKKRNLKAVSKIQKNTTVANRDSKMQNLDNEM